MRDDVDPGHSVIEVLVVLIVYFLQTIYTYKYKSITLHYRLLSKVMSILGIV